MKCLTCGEPGEGGAFVFVGKSGTQAVELRFILCEMHAGKFYEHLLKFIPPYQRGEIAVCPIR